jgi:flagellar protein FliL
MADNDENKKEKENEAPPEKKSMMKWIVIGVVIIVIAAGGFVGWRMFMAKDVNEKEGGDSATEMKAEKKEKELSIIFPLESFIVNLMDKSGYGKRYLKTTVELEVGDEDAQLMLQEKKAQLRDTILLLLSSQSFGEINSIEGKLELKQTLLVRINRLLGGKMVRRLYFTEFVVQ